tara:strand:- start:812 stop:1303 length:492 start_codon:yes stop_codon:yes gene_type:complete
MYQYSFANVDLIIDADYPGRPSSNPSSFTVQGFATGENLINVMRRAPIATTTFGAYGDMVLNMQRIRAGDLTFPVLMNSPENKYLQDWANYFQQQADDSGQLITPIQAKLVDNMGNDSATMSNGIILAMPSMSRGQSMNTNTWVLTFESVVFSRGAGGDAESL